MKRSKPIAFRPTNLSPAESIAVAKHKTATITRRPDTDSDDLAAVVREVCAEYPQTTPDSLDALIRRATTLSVTGQLQLRALPPNSFAATIIAPGAHGPLPVTVPGESPAAAIDALLALVGAAL